jgi:hypothetical protein
LKVIDDEVEKVVDFRKSSYLRVSKRSSVVTVNATVKTQVDQSQTLMPQRFSHPVDDRVGVVSGWA